MKRSKLKNKANKMKHPVDIKMYKKQRNYVVGLNKQAKFKYFNNLDCKKDAKPFWDKCKPYFSNKHSRGDTNIMLPEKGEILLKNDAIANTFSNFLDSLVKSINLFKWPDISWDSTILSSVLDRIDRIILKYKFHPSIISIKQHIPHIDKFSFRFVTLEDVRLINDLKNNKAAGGDIPLKLLKECDCTYEKLTNCINNSLSEELFPDSLKRANITPVYKKNDPLNKENYRPVSILHLF